MAETGTRYYVPYRGYLSSLLGFLFATNGRTRRLTASVGAFRLVLPPKSTMPTVDEDLNQIERDTRTLKIEYEQFFGGGRSRPPTDTQWRVDTLIRRYNERTAELSYGQRFRFNNQAQTYAKYQDMWRKKLIQKETSTKQQHFGAAAKAIEAERARKAAEQAAEQATEVATAEAVKPVFAQSFSDPDVEASKIEALYRKLIEARSETGESAGAPSPEDFDRFVRQKTKDLRDKGGREVEYTVSIEGGRVKLKARVSA
jgi:hypothetical protein